MEYPIRCFSCGAVIGHLFPKYLKRVKAGEHAGKVLDDLGVKKYCCRRMFLSYTEETQIRKFTRP